MRAGNVGEISGLVEMISHPSFSVPLSKAISNVRLKRRGSGSPAASISVSASSSRASASKVSKRARKRLSSTDASIGGASFANIRSATKFLRVGVEISGRARSCRASSCAELLPQRLIGSERSFASIRPTSSGTDTPSGVTATGGTGSAGGATIAGGGCKGGSETEFESQSMAESGCPTSVCAA